MSQHAQIPPIESICRPTYNTHFTCSLLCLVTVIWRQSYVFDLTSNQRWAVGWLEESTASVGCCQLLKLGLAPHCLNREAQRTGIGNNTQDWREEGAKAGETYCMPIQVTFLQQCWTLLAVDVLNPSQQWPTELYILKWSICILKNKSSQKGLMDCLGICVRFKVENCVFITDTKWKKRKNKLATLGIK